MCNLVYASLSAYAFPPSDFAKKQTMRMKVKSSQDVNDPAVKAAILEKV